MAALKLKLKPPQVKLWQAWLRQNGELSLAIEIAGEIRAHGGRCFLVGGAVRDLWLARTPKDFDLVSDWSAQRVEDHFGALSDYKVISVGKVFGIQMLVKDGCSIDVAQFRQDGAYRDGRHPEDVNFPEGENAAELDARRRDFTMNALFLDPEAWEIIDYCGGIADLESRTIRAIGEPSLRIDEDHLRILRAFRFRAELGFHMDPSLQEAIRSHVALVQKVSAERFFHEFHLLLRGPFARAVVEELVQGDLLRHLWPSMEMHLEDWAKGCDLLQKSLPELPESSAKGTGDVPPSISRESDAWISFWLGDIFARRRNGISDPEIFEALKLSWNKIRAPKAFQTSWTHNLGWILNRVSFSSLSEGAILNKIRDRDSHLGLALFWHALLSRDQSGLQEKWARVHDLERSWKGQWPAPLLRGEDLKDVSPPRWMGMILTKVFEWQLSRQVHTREEAMQKAVSLLAQMPSQK